MSLFTDASLVMIPSGVKDGKLYSIKPDDGVGDFTFTRGSNLAATRVDENGLIEKGRENLLLQSNQFDTTWTVNIGASITSGQTGYDGSNDAWLLSKSAISFASINQTTTATGVITFSAYVKAGTLSTAAIRLQGTPDRNFEVNLSDGTITGGSSTGWIDRNVDLVANGWYRCSFTLNNTGSVIAHIYAGGINDTTTGNIYIQDAQLELGLVATDYIETGATTEQAGILENLPRLDYTDSSCPSLLLEPTRTNLVTQSEYFASSDWFKTRVLPPTTSTSSPEGLANAFKLVEDGSLNTHYINDVISVTNGIAYTFSVFAKKAERSWVSLYNPFNAEQNYFDLTNGVLGTIGGSTSANIEDYGNGWYRCSISMTSNTTSTNAFITIANGDGLVTYQGNGTSGIYIYGAQFEAGSYPTSYIPTYGTAVTRNEGIANITTTNNLIGQTEGTLYWEGYIDTSKSNYGYFPRLITIGDGTGSNFAGLLLNQSNQLIGRFVISYINQANINYNITTSGTYKIAFSYAENNFSLYVNGVSVGTDTSGNVIGLDYIYLGYEGGTALTPPSHPTKQVLVFPTALTDTELIALTS